MTDKNEVPDKSVTYSNSDLGANSDPRDLSSAPELRSRIASIIAHFGSLDKTSQATGISTSQLSRYTQGKNEPSFRAIIALAHAGNVSPMWLATGEGEMRPSSTSTPAAPPTPTSSAAAIDEELMAKIVDGISRTYKDEGARIAPSDLGRLAARIHTDLAIAYDDPDERKVGLKAILAQLQRELRTTPTPQTTETKRRA